MNNKRLRWLVLSYLTDNEGTGAYGFPFGGQGYGSGLGKNVLQNVKGNRSYPLGVHTLPFG